MRDVISVISRNHLAIISPSRQRGRRDAKKWVADLAETKLGRDGAKRRRDDPDVCLSLALHGARDGRRALALFARRAPAAAERREAEGETAREDGQKE